MVIIIGAAGFIGQYTTEYFVSKGIKVIGTGRKDSDKELIESLGASFLKFDLLNEEDIKKLPTKDCEGIIVMAGLLPANSTSDLEDTDNAVDYFKINVIPTLNLLEFCRKNNIKKFLTASSYADVYNSWSKDKALTELEPRNYNYTGDHAMYVFSKNAVIDSCLYYNEQHGMNAGIFRLPPVYGVGPHSYIYVNGKIYKSGIQTFIDQAKEGKPIEIWGDGSLSRDIIYVKDVARACYLFIKSKFAKGLYNMTSGVPLTLLDQVRTVIDVFKDDKESEIILLKDKKTNTPSFLFDMTKAEKDFDFVPYYLDFKEMMLDYKLELESNKWQKMIERRLKK